MNLIMDGCGAAGRVGCDSIGRHLIFSVKMKLRSGLQTCPEARPVWNYCRDAMYVPSCRLCQFPVDRGLFGFPDECNMCRPLLNVSYDEDTPSYVYEEIASLRRFIRKRAEHYIRTGKTDLERGNTL